MKVDQDKLYSGVAAAAMLCALDGVASAADLPVKAAAPVAQPVVAAPNWTGFYLGGQLGYAWASKLTGDESGTAVVGGGVKLKGWAAGLHGGYNWQYAQWVFGLEGDINWAFSNGKKACSVTGCDSYIRGELNGLASIRGRLGYAFNNTLLFATMGEGWRRYKVEGYSGTSHQPVKTTISGLVWGGGIEQKLTQNLSAKIEVFRYLGSKTVNWGSDTSDGSGHVKAATFADAGLTWHF